MGYQPAVTIGQVDPRLRGELSLKQYVGNPRLQAMDRFVPPIDTHEVATLKTFRAVLDASGYALGDPWGSHTAMWLLRKYEQWSRRGLKIVALPQAYGPFRDTEVRKLAATALSKCDRIYAREEESYGHLLSLGIDENLCRICPDITIGERWVKARRARANRLVIVPNWHLANGAGSGRYVQTLADVAAWGAANNLQVVGLLHEGARDLSILDEVAKVSAIRIISDLSGWDVKEYIAGSALVVAGRYHAVVAALTTGTPVMTHSWSHKYRQLLRDFGVEGWLTDPEDSTSTIQGLETLLADDVSEAIAGRQAEMIDEVDRMWVDVQRVLSRGSGD